MKIKVNNLSKKFKSNIIFENVNLEFESGKIYGIVGLNGSGKSVFLKILTGLYYPTSGEILFDGVNYNKNNMFPKSLRALIEKPSFFSDLSAFDNLKLLANIQNKISDEDIINILKLVNLENNNKKYYQFSLGMKQKLAIASVLMEDVDVIILDEPFNAIEEKTVDKIKDYLLSIKKDKIIILCSHYKEDLKDLEINELYKFENGRVNKL